MTNPSTRVSNRKLYSTRRSKRSYAQLHHKATVMCEIVFHPCKCIQPDCNRSYSHGKLVKCIKRQRCLVRNGSQPPEILAMHEHKDEDPRCGRCPFCKHMTGYKSCRSHRIRVWNMATCRSFQTTLRRLHIERLDFWDPVHGEGEFYFDKDGTFHAEWTFLSQSGEAEENVVVV